MRRSTRAALACALPLSALAGAAATARAEQELPRVSVSADGCDALEPAEVERQTAVELSARLVDAASDGTSGAVTAIALACSGTEVRVVVHDPVSGKELRRTVQLDAVDEAARPRVLSLAVAELVSASWMEVELYPEPALAPVEAVATPAEREQVREAATRRAETGPRLTVGPWAGIRWLPSLGAPLGGGGLGVRIGGRGPGLALDVALEGGAVDLSGGRVVVTLATGSLAYAHGWQRGRRTLVLGAGARFGWARLGGSPGDATALVGAATDGAWGGPAAALGVDWRLSRWLTLGGAVEGGGAVVGLRGTAPDGDAVELSGAWLHGAVRFAVSR